MGLVIVRLSVGFRVCVDSSYRSDSLLQALLPRSVPAGHQSRILWVDTVRYGHSAVVSVELYVARNDVQTLAPNPLHADCQIMFGAPQQKASADGRFVRTRLVTCKGMVRHVIGGVGRMSEGLSWELSYGIHPQWAVAARFLAVGALSTLHGDNLVLLASCVLAGWPYIGDSGSFCHKRTLKLGLLLVLQSVDP